LQRNTLKIGKQSPSLALVHTSTVVGLGKNKTPSKQTEIPKQTHQEHTAIA
jgi:hypothetical protein